jgi:hypothetical protein
LLEDLPSKDEIKRVTDRLLKEAGAYGRLPTPVDDLIAAANLSESREYVLSESSIQSAPAHLRTILRGARQKIRGILDRRDLVIHVDPEVGNEAKRKFIKLHETTHQILPHQRDLVQVDTDATLSAVVKQMFEREANQGAAELLFQREAFGRMANDYDPSVDAPMGLAQLYGSSFHAAFRRYVETSDTAMVGIVFRPDPIKIVPLTLSRFEALASPRWTRRFGNSWPRAMSADRFPFLSAFDIGEFEFPWKSLDGARVLLRVQTKKMAHRRFALIWEPRRRLLRAQRMVRISSN